MKSAPSDIEPGTAVGVETEYAVRDGGRIVDFRQLLPEVAASPRPLRVAAPGRFLLENGDQLFADGRYAEIAIPPEPVQRQTSRRVSDAVFGASNGLLRRLAAVSSARSRPLSLHGYSTHLNVHVGHGHDGGQLAREFALTYGALLLFLTNWPSSRGIFCRPRPDRLEIVTEYVGDPHRLRAAITILVAAVCRLARASDDGGGGLPRLPASALRPADIRYGWWLPPELVSATLLAEGRRAPVTLADGRECTVQDLLVSAWTSLGSRLAGVDEAESRLVHEYIVRGRPVPIDRGRDDDETVGPVAVGSRGTTTGRLVMEAARPRRVGRWDVEAAGVYWQFLILAADSESRRLFVVVPNAELARVPSRRWQEALRRTLDATAAADTPPPTLSSLSDTAQPGVFSSVDVGALQRQMERTSHVKRPSPKRIGDCEVRIEAGKVKIGIPRTTDPLTLRPGVLQEPPQNDTKVADGVWVHNRTFVHSHIDHFVRGLGFDFAFERHYRSGILYDGLLGRGWDHGYNIRIVPQPPAGATTVPGGWCEVFPDTPGGGVTYYHGSGRRTEHPFRDWELRVIRWCDAVFAAVVSTYRQNNGESFEIERYAVVAGHGPEAVATEPIFYRVRVRGGTRLLFNCHGYVVEIRDRNTNRMRFQYGGPVNPTTLYNLLTTIEDTVGRTYSMRYQYDLGAAPRLVSLTEDTAMPDTSEDPVVNTLPRRTVTFDYTGAAELRKVVLVSGAAGTPEIHYGYCPAGRRGVLADVVNPEQASADAAYLHVSYDASEQVDEQRVGTPAGLSPAAGGRYLIRGTDAVTVTDRENVESTYVLRDLGDTRVVKEIRLTDDVFDGATGTTSKVLTTKYDYDDHYHITLIERPSGRKEHFRFRNANAVILQGDEFDNLLWPAIFTHRNDLARDDLLDGKTEPLAGETPFTTDYDYDRLFNVLTFRRTPLGVTRWTYDHGHCAIPENNGNALEIEHPPQRLPIIGELRSREVFAYGPGGQVATYTDPDLVRHVYEPYDSGALRGLVKTHKIGGQVEEQFTYDVARRLVTRTDGRASRWWLVYDARDNVVAVRDPLWAKDHAGRHALVRTYDLNDRLKTTTSEIADDADPDIVGVAPRAVATLVETCNYDILGNRVSLEQKATGPSEAGFDTRAWGWQYDKGERLVLASTPLATAGLRPDARIRYAYNARGLVKMTTDADAEGLTLSDSNPYWTKTYYDEDGRPAFVVDVQGVSHRSTYDAHGRPLSDAASTGVTRHLIYDGPHLTGEWTEGPISAPPIVRQGTVDDIVASATVKTYVLQETRYARDACQRVLRRAEKVFTRGKRERFDDKAVDHDDRVWTMIYSAAGRVLAIVDPCGRATAYRHNDQGRVKQVDVPGGHSIVHHYDGHLVDEVTTTFKPDREKDSVFDPFHPDTGGATPLPGVTIGDITVNERKRYDKLGRLRLVESQGVTTRYLYNSAGQVRAKVGPLGRTEYESDPFSRVEKETIHKVADIDSVTPAATVPAGTLPPLQPQVDSTISVQYRIDRNDNRTRLIDGLGRETVTTYDGHNLTASITRPEQATATITRRSDGRILKVTQDTITTTFTYTADGEVQSVVAETTGALTSIGLLVSRTTQVFGHDGAGRLTWCLDDNGDPATDPVQVIRAHDSLGRLLREQTIANRGALTHDRTVEYGYVGGSLFDIRTVQIAGEDRRLEYRSGEDGNLKEIWWVAPPPPATPGSIIIALAGRRVMKRIHQGPARTIETKQWIDWNDRQIELLIRHQYGPQGRLARRNVKIKDEIFNPPPATDPWLDIASGEEFTYGTHGLMETRTIPMLFAPGDPSIGRPEIPPGRIVSSFEYDGASRMFASGDDGAGETDTVIHLWDAANRPRVMIRGKRAGGGAPTFTQGVFTYPPKGSPPPVVRTDTWPNEVTKWTFDQRARLSRCDPAHDLSRTFGYDPLDRLQTTAFGGTLMTYAYLWDALGRLIGRREPNLTVIGPTGTVVGVQEGDWETFLYDGDTCIAEFGGTPKTLIRRYIYDDEASLLEFHSGGLEFLPIATFDGSPWFLLLRQTKTLSPTLPAQPTNPDAAARLDYYMFKLPLLVEAHRLEPFGSAFGFLDYSTGVPVQKPAQFSRLPLEGGGRRRFRQETLLYGRGRFYEPSLAAYINPGPADPLGNPTTYAANNPALYTEDGRVADIAWGSVAWTASKTAAVGIGVTVLAGAAVALSPIVVPLVLVGGLVVVTYSAAVASYESRNLRAMETGVMAPPGTVAGVAALDALGISGFVEGYSGRELITGRVLSSEARSERLGGSVGTALAIVAAPLGFRLGGGAARGFVRWWRDPMIDTAHLINAFDDYEQLVAQYGSPQSIPPGSGGLEFRVVTSPGLRGTFTLTRAIWEEVVRAGPGVVLDLMDESMAGRFNRFLREYDIRLLLESEERDLTVGSRVARYTEARDFLENINQLREADPGGPPGATRVRPRHARDIEHASISYAKRTPYVSDNEFHRIITAHLEQLRPADRLPLRILTIEMWGERFGIH